MTKNLSDIVDYQYASDTAAGVRRKLEELIARDDKVYVVIDDDPTGGQTVHDIEVLTVWDEQNVLRAMESVPRMFYIMTNSRGMTADQTRGVHQMIIANLNIAAEKTQRRFEVISRGDSTLRGHYPLEPDTIAAAVEGAKHLLIPYFREGDRYTIGDVHYLKQSGEFIPAGKSEFSRDKTFGYRASDLKEWIVEKTHCQIESVGSVSLEMLRSVDYAAIEGVLSGPFERIVVNAACDDDLRVFAVAYLRSVARGVRFVARTAAGWPKIIGDVEDAPLLDCGALADGSSTNGGLVVVGSHVEKTTAQLHELRASMPELGYVEFNQHLIMDEAALRSEVRRSQSEISRKIASGRSCVLYTRRQRLDYNLGSAEDELVVTRRISDAVTEVVAGLDARPSFIVAKGGITSSDIAVNALGIRRAMIMGQAAAGVPVWKAGLESKYPGLSYVIFPGNVGDENALRDVVLKLCDRGVKK